MYYVLCFPIPGSVEIFYKVAYVCWYVLLVFIFLRVNHGDMNVAKWTFWEVSIWNCYWSADTLQVDEVIHLWIRKFWFWKSERDSVIPMAFLAMNACITRGTLLKYPITHSIVVILCIFAMLHDSRCALIVSFVRNRVYEKTVKLT